MIVFGLKTADFNRKYPNDNSKMILIKAVKISTIQPYFKIIHPIAADNMSIRVQKFCGDG